MQLLCRHEQNQYYNLEPESHYLWPYGEFLRLYRIADLPSPLPDIRAPLMPPLQPGFTAAQALRRITVKGTRHSHNGCQPAASMVPEQLVACTTECAYQDRDVEAGKSLQYQSQRRSNSPCFEDVSVQISFHLTWCLTHVSSDSLQPSPKATA